MSLELKSAEVAAIDSLWKAWSTSTDSELEATFRKLDYTNFLNIVKYLRSLGLTESPQPPKLNILTASGLRFSLVGSGVIEQYCNDNTLKGKPFHVILKEKKAAGPGGSSEAELKDYDVRIKVRREITLPVTDQRVAEALGKWAMLPKAFRYIQRYSFTSLHHKGIQFDASFVHENKKDRRGNYVQSTTFLGAAINKQPVHYEMEVEALTGASQKSLMVGIALVLRGLQKSYVLVRETVKQSVVELLKTQTGAGKDKFPGSQPVTLNKKHIGIESDADTPNLRADDYNVTDKADGLRCLMVVAKNGRIYLVDRNLNVYGTDRRLDDLLTIEWAGAVLDGEWVTQDAAGAPVCRYYAFDIFNGRRGEDVSGRPFLVRSEVAVSRLAAMTETIAVLNNSGHTVADIPLKHSLSIFMKSFHTPLDTSDPTGIFKVAADVLDRLAKNPPYHTDGLIFTPNAAPLAKNVNTWKQQFKWKPATMNSVDFLVVVEKERGLEGKPTGVDLISTKLREDTNQIVRFKTLRLFVGSSADPAFVDPRATVLEKKPYPAGMDRAGGDYRPVEFAPQPPDPMAAICYIAINAGATDAAGAAPGAQALDALDDSIYTEETHDSIQNRSIVEMVYDPLKPAGWRWKPLRVRWDKTEQFQRGIIGGTVNSELVANDVWNSIHDPITELMIRTGAESEVLADATAGAAAGANAYYQRRASQRDMYKIRGLTQFHNTYIKEDLLLSRVLTAGSAVADLSVGQAGDIHKWLRSRVGFVMGTDIALSGLIDNKNGAYRRYLDQMIQRKGNVPPMVFIQADSGLRLSDGSAGQTVVDRTILRTLWGEHIPDAPALVADLRGVAARGFDVATLMFSLHYFFKDLTTVEGLFRNLSETVKVGGYFVGCCFDGHTVAGLLRDTPLDGVKRGTEDATDLWTITKKYEGNDLPDNETGLGKAIDVGFISIGEAYTEYLVSFPYLQSRLSEFGFELLNTEEQAGLGLLQSTNMFKDSFDMAAASGRTFPMSSTVKQFSFLNRWFIFRRRSTGRSAIAPSEAAASVLPVIVPLAAPVEAPPQIELQEDIVPPAEGDIDTGLVVANGPAYQFYHKSAAKDELKIGDKNWKRYLSTFAPFTFKDPANPAITYSCLEAALGAAKFAVASNKPELGPQIFSEAGSIHQKIEARKRELTGGIRALSAEETAMFMEEEGNAYKDALKTAAVRKVGATINEETWETTVDRLVSEFVRQRFEGDKHFKEILEAVSSVRGRLVYYTAGGSSVLSGAVRPDGTIEGKNAYGRALMRIVGLRMD